MTKPNPELRKPYKKPLARSIALAGAVVLGSFAGSYLAGENNSGSQKDAAHIEAPTPFSAEELQQKAVIEKAQKQSNHELSKSILDFAQNSAGDPRVEVATRSWRELSPRGDIDPSLYNTTVTVTAGNLIGDSGGEYVITVSGHLNPDTGMVNPATADALSIKMYTGVDEKKYVPIYSYDSAYTNGNAIVAIDVATKGYQDETGTYTSELIGSNSMSVLRPLGDAQSDILRQATTVTDWAITGTPVNLVLGK